MKDEASYDDLGFFLAVADAGGLARAVVATGQSAPTLSRRMTALEQQIGRRLFVRGNRGYALTADGRTLREAVAPLTEVRRSVAQWTGAANATRVRITAGALTSRWLATHLPRFWQRGDPWIPEFLASSAVLDISRREADIGFRNRRPDQSWLAARRLRSITYATFAVDASVTGYITMAEDLATTPTAKWVRQHHADSIVTTVSDPRLAIDLALAGSGCVVIPVFAASGTGLFQVSDQIDELTHDEWLVTHHEARHDPPVRRALEAIAAFVRDV